MSRSEKAKAIAEKHLACNCESRGPHFADCPARQTKRDALAAEIRAAMDEVSSLPRSIERVRDYAQQQLDHERSVNTCYTAIQAVLAAAIVSMNQLGGRLTLLAAQSAQPGAGVTP